MATISVKFRTGKFFETGKGNGGKAGWHEAAYGTVYYQVIQQRKVRLLASGYRLTTAEWEEIISGSCRNCRLKSVADGISLDLDRLRRIIDGLQRKPTGFSADDVSFEFRRIDRELRMGEFTGKTMSRLIQQGRARTAETYHAAVRSFRQYWLSTGAVREPGIDHLTADNVCGYNEWLRDRGAVNNTISFYNRVLRAIYNRALDTEEMMEDRRPFRRVYTGVDKTRKRALPLDAVSRIAALDLSRQPPLDFARDMFILSFSLRGMSFIDMAFLHKNDLRDGRLCYRRRKTGQRLEIEWTSQMQRIIDKYPPNETDFLLPIIRHKGSDERCAYRNSAYNINRSLKTVGAIAGVAMPLTLYAARPSGATAAMAKGIPISVISEGMGHDSERTTRIYLAQFDTAAVDRANALILDSIDV